MFHFRDVDNDGWAIDATTQTIQMLLEIEKTNFSPKEHENPSAHAGDFSRGDDISSSENDIDVEEDEVAEDQSEIATDSETVSLNIEESLGHTERKRDFVDESTEVQSENAESEKETDAEHDELLSPTSSMGGVRENSKETKSKSDESLINKLVDEFSIRIEDSVGKGGQDVGNGVELSLH